MERALFMSAWLVVLSAAVSLPVMKLPRGAKWLFPASGLLLLVLFRDQPPALRLLASSLLFLYLMKAAVLVERHGLRLTLVDRLFYGVVWPGMDPENFARREPPPDAVGSQFGKGLALVLVGGAACLGLAAATPRLDPTWTGWLGIASLICVIHFGGSAVLTSLFRFIGRPLRPLFDQPLASKSLSDFWTKRWNLAFVEMDRRLFLPPLTRAFGLRRAVFGVFMISGLLHEMAISYPAGAGWGMPTAYFAIQCLGLALERRMRVRSRAWTFLWILAPLPLLFHAPFRSTLIVPLFEWLHALIVSWPPESLMHALLWSLPVLQLAVLLASFQVPGRLRWHEELPRLSAFNRKLMWTYGVFIVVTILGFAILTATLHESFMRGETSAAALALFMAAFWVLRIVFDAVYFDSNDWPPGVDLKIGHALLNALFAYLALGYGVVGIWAMTR